MTRKFCARAERRRSTEIFALSKVRLVAIIVFLTGHCSIEMHAVRLKIESDANCQSCKEEGEVETSTHFLLHCRAFVRARRYSRN